MARDFNSDELVIATHNAGKAREIEALLKPYSQPKRFYTANDLDFPEPVENEKTFIGNAELKAVSAAKHTGKPALADDSGLSVEALGGEPGIYSARWALTEDGSRDFSMAMEKIRKALLDKNEEPEGARASFVCVLSLAWPDGHVESFEGAVHGCLSFPPRGDKGFGYDPIFIADGQDVTFAQMEPEAKHAISHRADAFKKFIESCFSH